MRINRRKKDVKNTLGRFQTLPPPPLCPASLLLWYQGKTTPDKCLRYIGNSLRSIGNSLRPLGNSPRNSNKISGNVDFCAAASETRVSVII